MSIPEDFMHLAPKLEDGCSIGSSDSDAALISLAISMKRIANVLEGKNGSLTDYVSLVADRMPMAQS